MFICSTTREGAGNCTASAECVFQNTDGSPSIMSKTKQPLTLGELLAQFPLPPTEKPQATNKSREDLENALGRKPPDSPHRKTLESVDLATSSTSFSFCRIIS